MAEYLDNVKQAIITAQDSAKPYPFRYTGFSKGMTVKAKGGKAFLSGANYLPTNFYGIKPKKIFPWKQITQWLTKGGLINFPVRDAKGRFIPRKSLAYLIASKIWQKGSAVHRGERPGIPIKKILQVNLVETGNKMAEAYAKSFTDDLKKTFNQKK